MTNIIRHIKTLGRANASTLVKSLGFKNINQAIEFHNVGNVKSKKYSQDIKTHVLEIMRDEYNNIADDLNTQTRTEQKRAIQVNKEKSKENKKNKKQKVSDDLKRQVTVLPFANQSKLRKELEKMKGESIIVEYIIKKADLNKLNKVQQKAFALKHPNGDFDPVVPGDDSYLIKNKYVVKSIQYDVPDKFSSWWKKHSRDWWVNSAQSIFDKFNEKEDSDAYELLTYGNIYIYRQGIDTLNTNKITQLFREGITNCLFTPIRLWAMNKLDDAKTKPTKSRYNVIIKNINVLEEMYKNGVPEDAVSQICNKLQVDISIELPFGTANKTLIEGQSIKKRLKYFKFMNTRLNHVDLNEVVHQDKPIEITREELLEVKDELDQNGTFYTFNKDMTNVSSITTLTHQYTIANEFGAICQKFEIDNGLNFCKIDDIDDRELSHFINSGTNYNVTVDFQDIDEAVDNNHDGISHIDMYRAYSQFKKCWAYEGFLGKITDFRQTNKIMGVGLYMITNIMFDTCVPSFKAIHDKLSIYVNNCVYTSAELKMLDLYNVTYEIVGGCWGVKPIEFEFNTDMMEKKDEGVNYYSKWAGKCDTHRVKKQFWIKGDKEYFDIIRNNCEEGVVKWFENNEGCIEFPKKHNYHLGHITAFITAYQRISVIEQLHEFDISNIVRVCSDGIYFTGECVPLKNVFRIKKDIKLSNEASSRYVDKLPPIGVDWGVFRDHYNKELHIGEGGCGKTHYNCIDKGLIKTMFLAPSWKLARGKQVELGINCSVWARAICSDPEKITAIKERANVLIIDEVSMLSEEQKELFFKIYGDMKIIMCGDLGYQLPCIEGEEMKDTGFDNIVSHKTDHRCKDERLKAIKNTLRAMILQKRSKNYINQWVVDEFRKYDRVIGLETLNEKYDVKDTILTGTNETKDFYTNIFKEKFPTEKYFMKENNRLYCNGDIVITHIKPDSKCDIQHAFTSHSFQGETCEDKLFIDSSRMFDSRMFYTAISRARRLDQIFIIEIKKEPTFKYDWGKIYKITGNNKTYIGSTVGTLEVRFTKHNNDFKSYNNGKGKYITSFDCLSDPNAKIEKLENFKCNDLKDLWFREAEIIKQYGNKCVNKTYNEMK